MERIPKNVKTKIEELQNELAGVYGDSRARQAVSALKQKLDFGIDPIDDEGVVEQMEHRGPKKFT